MRNYSYLCDPDYSEQTHTAMTKRIIHNCWLLIVCFILSACEKVVIEEETPQDEFGNVTLSVSGCEQLADRGRGAEDISKVCSRMHFVIYKDGEKQKAINQKAGDASFGQVSLTLDPGDYEVLILGHSCPGKDNPNMKEATKIQFSNLTDSGNGTGYSDTFYYYGTLSVDSKSISQSFLLKRAVAMFRFTTTDVKPSNIKKFRFYYTGGSGALNATTGLGCVNSKQLVYFDTPDSEDGKPMQFDIFTFLHATAGQLTIQIKALDSNDNAVFERTFEDVPMERNTITQYSGTFFVNGDDTPETPGTPENPESSSNTIQVETEWADTRYFTF